MGYAPNKDDVHRLYKNAVETIKKEDTTPATTADLLDYIYYAKYAMYRGRMCQNTQREIVVLVDTSSKISLEELNGMYKAVLLLATGFSAVGSLPPNPKASNATLTLISYADEARLHFKHHQLGIKGENKTEDMINEAFSSMTLGGNANTATALRYAREHTITEGNHFKTPEEVEKLSSKENLLGAHVQVVIMTNGNSHDSTLLVEEALRIKSNRARVIMIAPPSANEFECRRVTSCLGTSYCPEYLNHPLTHLHEVISGMLDRICGGKGRNAICKESWSVYSTCSARCGLGISIATLQNVATVLPPIGEKTVHQNLLTCEEQYKSVKSKVTLCNTEPCKNASGSQINVLQPGVHGNTNNLAGMGRGRILFNPETPLVETVAGALIPAGDVVDSEGHPTMQLVEEMGYKEGDTDGTQEIIMVDPKALPTPSPSGDAITRSSDNLNEPSSATPIETNEEEPEEPVDETPLEDAAVETPSDIRKPTVHHSSHHVSRNIPGGIETHQRHVSHESSHTKSQESYTTPNVPSYIMSARTLMIVGGTLAFIFILAGLGVFACYIRHKDSDSFDDMDDSELLNADEGGNVERAEGYQIAEANDTVWA
uniref:VWFA domain-containing protein n=1 Tax=Babesia sp. WA1 TaxID=153269 RepID=Q4JR58_9APIC|nr:unknown [Babesia sp. WA1]